MQQLIHVEQIVQDIKDIKIQGATNIAKAAFEIIILESKSQNFISFEEYSEFVMIYAYINSIINICMML